MSGSDDCFEIKIAKHYGAIFVPKLTSDFLTRVKEVANGECEKK